MKIILLFILTVFTLILSISPQPPDFNVSPVISVKIVGPNNKEPVLQIFPLDSDFNIQWTSKGINDNPIVLIQVYYIFPTIPKETYVPLFKEPKESKLNEKIFKLRLGSDLFEANKFYLVTITSKDDQSIFGTSESFGVCIKCD